MMVMVCPLKSPVHIFDAQSIQQGFPRCQGPSFGRRLLFFAAEDVFNSFLQVAASAGQTKPGHVRWKSHFSERAQVLQNQWDVFARDFSHKLLLLFLDFRIVVAFGLILTLVPVTFSNTIFFLLALFFVFFVLFVATVLFYVFRLTVNGTIGPDRARHSTRLMNPKVSTCDREVGVDIKAVVVKDLLVNIEDLFVCVDQTAIFAL
mmetsp:Transcript_28324/g.55703  ORF Transcript_28324/g.55703 Transcript_28324/m.55703 type:complete len:205 (-) Transcript_28324:1417-2031(-)